MAKQEAVQIAVKRGRLSKTCSCSWKTKAAAKVDKDV